MGKRLRNRLGMVLVLALSVSCFSGCWRAEKEAGAVPETSVFSTGEIVDSGSSESEETQIDHAISMTVEENDFREGSPINYTWNPYVFSQVNLSALDEGADMVFYDWIDAIINGEASVACPSEDMMWDLEFQMSTFFPPFSYLVSDFAFSDGQIVMQFSTDADTRDQILRDFADQLAFLIHLAEVNEEDSQTVRAIKLYRMFSGIVSYDYVALASEEIVDLSAYRAIMQYEGICQSFAPAYAYLCLQVGIDATTTGGMTDGTSGDIVAHDWTLLELNDKYYYADTTFENGMGGGGLMYFGMTSAQRELEGGFIADEYNIGGSNEIWGNDFEVSDEAFAPLWNCVYVISVENSPSGVVILCEDGEGNTFEFSPDAVGILTE